MAHKPIAFRPTELQYQIIKAYKKTHHIAKEGLAVQSIIEDYASLSEDDEGGKSPFSFKSELTLACPPRLVCAITKTWHEREKLLRQCEDCIMRQEGQCGAWQSSP